MKFPDNYACLRNATFRDDRLELQPLRYQDRYAVMRWRNRQLDLLRQSVPLTPRQQDHYFTNVVAAWYRQPEPEGLLFGMALDGELIGYGGLVHIDWHSANAEVSFLLADPSIEGKAYIEYFRDFLTHIERIGQALNFHRLYCVGYAMMMYRFRALLESGYQREVTLEKHVRVKGQLCDVLVHGKNLSTA